MNTARFLRAFAAALRRACAETRRPFDRRVSPSRWLSRALTRGKSATSLLKADRPRNQSSQSVAALAKNGLISQCDKRQRSAKESSASRRFVTLRPGLPSDAADIDAADRPKISTIPFFTKYIPSAGVDSVIIMYCLPKKRCSRDSMSRRMNPDSQSAKKSHPRTMD